MILYRKFVNIDYKIHLFISLIVRVLLISYGIYHDKLSTVPYTDIDYKVFTDASRHILHNRSPYERHTYRYSPLLAIFMIPNLILHHSFGKVLFSLIDLLVAFLIRLIVKSNLEAYYCYSKKCKLGINECNILNIEMEKAKLNCRTIKSSIYQMADLSMMVWLYNPLTIAIATRGNCDSLASFLVLSTLYLIQCKKLHFITGLMHGVSIHFRLFPVAYSLALFMYLSTFSFYTPEGRKEKKIPSLDIKQLEDCKDNFAPETIEIKNNVECYNKTRTIFKKEFLLYLVPNWEQLKLVSGSLFSLFGLISLFYYLYGYTFLYETYIYHLIRKDTRHNFSVFFYLQYLTSWVKNVGMWQKVLMVLPQIVLLLVLSVRYGLNKFSLNFSILTQTIVMVTYNSVLTSQYFVWILAVLPLCMWQIKMSLKTAIWLIIIWFAAQVAWLIPAYLLEFQGQNTFLFIWVQSVAFFCANIAILGRLIRYFMPVNYKIRVE